MKRIRCPKCSTPIQFDETLYAPGRILVFECPDCNKQFRIRIPQPRPADEQSETESLVYGRLVVLENDFQLRQELPLHEGDNVVGKHVRGTTANAAFLTVDPSIDPVHCIVNVRPGADGTPPRLTLRDDSSNTGTFLMNELLPARSRLELEDGAVINIGAATLILQLS